MVLVAGNLWVQVLGALGHRYTGVPLLVTVPQFANFVEPGEWIK